MALFDTPKMTLFGRFCKNDEKRHFWADSRDFLVLQNDPLTDMKNMKKRVKKWFQKVHFWPKKVPPWRGFLRSLLRLTPERPWEGLLDTLSRDSMRPLDHFFGDMPILHFPEKSVKFFIFGQTPSKTVFFGFWPKSAQKVLSRPLDFIWIGDQ